MKFIVLSEMSDDVAPDQRNAMEKFVAEYEKTTTDKLNFQFMVCLCLFHI